MNLLEIRQMFRNLSGRADLVNKDGSDNGANIFINAGSKFLDRTYETQKSWASCFRILEVGSFNVTVPYCRAIKEVWVATSEERWQLKKYDIQDLITCYMADLPSSRETGTPLYYSPCLTRHIPEDASVSDLGAFVGFVEVPAGDAHEYNTILLNVPTDTQLMVDVRGLFYSAALVDDEDKNYWSAVHPLLLYMSAMRQIEVVYRNTQGVTDWTNSIMTEMTQLGMDLVEELIAEADEMED